MKFLGRMLAITAACSCLLVVPLLAESYRSPREKIDPGSKPKADLQAVRRFSISRELKQEWSLFCNDVSGELGETLALQYRTFLRECKKIQLSP
jgi:hypothetical protein